MTKSPRPARVRPKTIAEVVAAVPGAQGYGDLAAQVTGITHDSRDARSGDLYLARAGGRTHGIAHVAEAVAGGAVAVLTDPASVPTARATSVQAVVEVPDPRGVAGRLAAWIYDDPSADLLVVGVTGTNGKTTTTFLLEGALRGAGRTPGLVGTVETRVGAAVLPSARTTPEATDLQALLALMREQGVDSVALEVSSHALDLGRVDGVTFAVAGFTNLSQDHLDFHHDMEHYFAAKSRLFTPELARRGVVCVDDDWGRRLARDAAVPVVTVGGPTSQADWVRTGETLTAAGGAATLTAPDREPVEIGVSLPGQFNLANAALAFVMLVDAGLPPAGVAAGIRTVTAVPGRMERIDQGQPFVALVDYAHTPEALRVLVHETRGLAGTGRVLIVVGCGGERDRSKRPAMGAAAATADVAVLTTDNPRSEDPAAILAAAEGGARAAGTSAQVVVEPDRRAAIAAALTAAAPGDVVVVAGKGHERTQEFADRVIAFDDRDVLRECLAGLGYPGEAA